MYLGMRISRPLGGFRQGHTEPFDDALLVVIVTSRSLAALHQALQHDLFGAREKEDRRRETDLQCCQLAGKLEEERMDLPFRQT